MLHNLFYTLLLQQNLLNIYVVYVYWFKSLYFHFLFIRFFFLLLFIDATLFMPLKCILEIICSVMYQRFIKHVFYQSLNLERIQVWLPGVFLINELRVTSYELQVTIYCTSYKLLFIYELRVTIYCRSYELLFINELRVTIYCTSYELPFINELRVTIYCTSSELLFTYELRVITCCTSYELNL